MPKVSIIMPAYNKENYIQKTLDSIIQQKFIVNGRIRVP